MENKKKQFYNNLSDLFTLSFLSIHIQIMQLFEKEKLLKPNWQNTNSHEKFFQNNVVNKIGEKYADSAPLGIKKALKIFIEFQVKTCEYLEKEGLLKKGWFKILQKFMEKKANE